MISTRNALLLTRRCRFQGNFVDLMVLAIKVHSGIVIPGI